jgi:1,4-dihydroxy-2-naphthoate polyprenyltransferase
MTARAPAMMPHALAAWGAAVRPKTLGLSLGGVAVGAAVAHADGVLRWDATLAAALVAIALQIAANLVNDYGDFVRGADRERLGPVRAAQSGAISARALCAGAALAVVVALAAGMTIVARLGVPALALGLAAMLSAIAYTAGPAPLAYLGLGDAFVVAFFGGAAVAGTYYAQTGATCARALWLSLPVGAIATAILVVNNVRDRDGDRRAGKRTLVVRFGERFGRAEYAALLAIAYMVPAALAIATARPWLCLPLVSAPWAWRQVRRVATTDGSALNRELERSAQLAVAFDVLLAVGAWR